MINEIKTMITPNRLDVRTATAWTYV